MNMVVDHPGSVRTEERPDTITVALIEGFVPYSSTIRRTDTFMNGYQKAVERAMEEEPDLLVGSEYSFFPFEPLKETEAKSLLEELRGLSEAHPDTLMMPGTMIWQDGSTLYNTLPVFQGGEQVGRYDKHSKAVGEDNLSRACGLPFSSDESDAVYDLKGYSVGVDICLDHAKQVLKDSLDHDVDLHVTLAHGKQFFPEAAAVDVGGYHLRCDSDDHPSLGASMAEVRYRGEGDPERAATYHLRSESRSLDLGDGFTLRVYELEMV